MKGRPTTAFIDIPSTFIEMPRWWHEGHDWLRSLSETTKAVCHGWNLTIEGEIRHGSNAIVIPVRRNEEQLALRMAPPDNRNRAEVRALRFWDGHGTVRLVDADTEIGATLLERLAAHRPLSSRPLPEAMPVIARLIRRLAIPAPPDARSTASLVEERAAAMPSEWRKLNIPFDQTILHAALDIAEHLNSIPSCLAVNGDLHFDQVLAGDREPWLVVDPMLLRGDIAYDIARILWSRLDAIAVDTDVVHWFDMIVTEAGLDRDRAAAWVLFRSVDYWLWGLTYGLTEDPLRCARLVRIFR